MRLAVIRGIISVLRYGHLRLTAVFHGYLMIVAEINLIQILIKLNIQIKIEHHILRVFQIGLCTRIIRETACDLPSSVRQLCCAVCGSGNRDGAMIQIDRDRRMYTSAL